LSGYPAVRCNAPEFSAVIDAAGRVRPCFFIPGPPDAHVRDGIPMALNVKSMRRLRSDIRERRRPECQGCVCSMWRDPASLSDTPFALPEASAR